MFGKEIPKYTVIYSVYTYAVLDNPKHELPTRGCDEQHLRGGVPAGPGHTIDSTHTHAHIYTHTHTHTTHTVTSVLVAF